MQILLHIDDTLARRFKEAVPARQRSAYVQKLLEAALPPEDKDARLERIAREVEAELDANPGLREEQQAWVEADLGSWDNLPPFDETDLHPHLRSK